MANFLKGFFKFIAIITAILFVITLVLSFFLYSIENSAFDADTYKKALEDGEVYERLPAVIGDQLVLVAAGQNCEANPVTCGYENRSPELGSCLEEALGREAYQSLAFNERMPTEAEKSRILPCFDEYGYPEKEEDTDSQLAIFKNLTAKDWEVLITSLFTQDTLQSFTEESMDAAFDFLNGNADSVEIPLYLIKEPLLNEEGVDAVFAFLAAQPPCTTEDMLEMANAMTGGELVFCNPPEESIVLIKPMIEAQLKTYAENIPDTQTVLKDVGLNTQFLEAQSVRVLMRLSPLVPLGLLMLITVLVVRSLQSWLRWWGIPMLIAGGLGLLFSLMAGPMLQFLFNLLFLSRVPMELSGSVLDLSYDIFTSVAHNLVENMALYALITAIIGAAMTLSAFISSKKESV